MTEHNLIEKPIFKFALREDLKNEKQFLPSRTESKATCWDVKAAFPDRNSLVLKPFQRVLIPLGFRTFCPEGWWFRLNPRSSTYGKKHLGSLYGIIDETYEGELLFACQYLPELVFEKDTTYEDNSHFGIVQKTNIKWDSCFEKTLTIEFGDSIGQIYPVKRDEMIVEEVSNEEYDLLCKNRQGERGIGGFGSSDKIK
jgi:dUTPase